MLIALALPAKAEERGIASVDDGKPTRFDGGYYGGRVADGSRYSSKTYTVAHRTVPLGTILQITNNKDRQRGYFRVNERGPCGTHECQRTAPPRIKVRIADLTPAGADMIGLDGLGQVTIRVCRIVKTTVAPIRICE